MLLSDLIKESREAKNISQKDLAQDILSPQHLSHFENNYSSILATKYFSLIKKLNITTSEIDYYLEWNNSQNELMSAIQNAISTKNESIIYDLIQNQLSLFTENDNSIHKHNLVILYQNLEKYFGQSSNDEYPMQLISDYLLNSPVWHSYELNLLEAIVHFSSETSLRAFFETGKSRLSSNIDMGKARKKIARLYILAINQSIDQSNVTFTKFLVINFKEFLSKNNLFNEQTVCLFYEGIILIQNDKYTQGMAKASKALEIMKFADDIDAYNKYNEMLNTIIV
ncbi:Rgg/GadR/MutR family transcriptional regulator [Ruoffia tabacinasalis]|uniref:Helix-turn-helix domain-containing protein n=1 Tax=Ruoffia tabacinasalis TaxID=87458 RepID=A0ABS0LJ01_9LACT|nr:Rgg/GadR/MutR family transcriptional regulator [Ruoffia tabacinasalis]MBG9978261.1 helix-turn-helix domain-containing protein [Ruoffia tabacinasalis]